MTDDQPSQGLHIDDDWKSEAAREKDRLAEQEQAAAEQPDAGPGQIGFLDLLNLIAIQASVALGGARGPSGEHIPANPALAQHHIDLLAVLQEKTKGNLTPDEARTLDAVIYELRMHFVNLATAPPPAGEPGGPGVDA